VRPDLLIAAAHLAAALSVGTLSANPAQDYTLYCMGCHGSEAQGVPGKIPPLAGSLGRFMRTPEGRAYVLRVPGAANSALSDEALAAVLNWLAERYPAPEAPQVRPFTTEEVAGARHSPLANLQATRRRVIESLAATGTAPPAQY